MIGTLQPAFSSRFLISGTTAAASGTFTVQRTISLPASASSSVCCRVVFTSAVSVLVIDCTTMGAPPPTCTWPTFTPYVFFRGCRSALASNPAIWFNIYFYFSIIRLSDAPHFVVLASPGAGSRMELNQSKVFGPGSRPLQDSRRYVVNPLTGELPKE